jgi:membrane-associated protein
MEMLQYAIDLFLHLDKHLGDFISAYGLWVYLALFVVIFLETGLVVTPFLPGDSLLFASGALAARGSMSFSVVFVLVSVAAILGDTVNYWIGAYFGGRIVRGEMGFLRVKQDHLDRTHAFFERYGGKTIIIARFVPIVRTVAPFVAGLGSMTYRKFIAYNIIGGLLWVVVCVGGGYVFSDLPFVRDHFSIVIMVIIAISLIPVIVGYLQTRKAPEKTASDKSQL